MTSTVATVNGAPIDDKALNAAMQSLAQEQYHATLAEMPPEACADLRQLALERLIARELMFQAAMAEGVLATNEAVEEETSRILRMMGNPQDFWKRMAERGMDEAAFLRMIRKDVTVDQISARKLEELPEPEDAAILDFFRQYPDKLKSHERLRVAHILIPFDPDDADKALPQILELKKKAETGDFAELAKLHSVCPSAPGGGDLGYIRREDVDSTFADAAFSQIVGVVGEPVKTPFGYHLLLVKEHEIPAPLTLDEARPKIVHFLKQAESAKILECWVNEMKQQADIVLID